MSKDRKKLEKAKQVIKEIMAKLNCLPMASDEFLGEVLYERIQYILEQDDDER